MQNIKHTVLSILMMLALLISLMSCKKDEYADARWNQPHYALLYVYDDTDKMVGADGVLPGDTLRIGEYKIVYEIRR